ncbi:MAG: DNA replication/repair protein RecF [Clostridia bacterium]|nr:DNA replication/repair protein RecF [Clostridia bacterium]
MRLDHIELLNFRNIEKLEADFSWKTNAIVGKNGQGKTNLMEAVYLMACGKSFRTSRFRDMIRYGEERAQITLQASGEGLPFQLKMVLDAKEGKAILKNDVKLQKLSDFLGLFRVVLFCPEHLSLIKDGPGKRRSFIDGAICQLRPYYASFLNECNKIEAQRAALLKSAQKKSVPEEMFSVWNERLASVSVKIACIRADYLKLLKEKAPRHYDAISGGKESLSLTYVSDVYKEELSREEMEKRYLSLLEVGLSQDIRYGFTQKGIHRDDVEILMDGRLARNFASQGQQRSAVLALKLAEGEISEEMTGNSPVYLLDDVLSELDEERREYITNGLLGKQVILTGTDKEDFLFVDKSFTVNRGSIEK